MLLLSLVRDCFFGESFFYIGEDDKLIDWDVDLKGMAGSNRRLGTVSKIDVKREIRVHRSPLVLDFLR